ncbi:unnamed protein product [Rotaria sordida]|uniref:TRPM SLOG domain-containing protein n=1 Tax=Rotaria sordida TaxID=392033 RepID=A0A815BAR1_9BILA|nr:unnamed protein product [Rotaria sordida]CAF1576078.1 unnamed protein product [Rotaria sordida]
MSPYTDMQQQENKPIERKQDKPHDRSSVTSEVSTSRCRRTSSESFAQFTENDDDEPLVGKQTEELSSAAQIVHFMRRAWKLPVPDDNFEEGDRHWKAKFVDRLRADLILPMRAQIEQESRKVTQQGQTFMIPIVQILVEGGVSSILTVCESIKAKTPVIVIDDDDNLSRPLPLEKSANTTTSSNPSTGNELVSVAFDVADQNQNHHSNSNQVSINITQWNYYKTYLNRDLKADLRQKQMEQTDVSGKNSSNPVTDNYGIIDHFRKKDSFLHEMVVFNGMDVIHRSGRVTEIKINFIQSSRDKQFPEVFLYIVSPGKDQNEFTIIYRHEISDEIIGAPIITGQLTSSTVPTERQNIASNNDNITSGSSSTRPTDSNAHTSSKVAGKLTKLTTETTDASVNSIIRTLNIQEPTLYVQAGQYLAIGFGCGSTRLCRVKRSDSYYITRSWADTTVQSGKPVKDEEFAVSILTENSQRYFNYSPLQLAKESNSRSFLATKCVQKYLDKKWFGTIDNHRHSMFWNVVLIFYVAFLCLFSYVLLVDYFPINNNGGTRNGYFIIIPITEIVLHILMFSILIEECIEFLLYYAEKRLCNIHWIPWKYFTIDKWNILDVIAILFYIAGFIPRWISSESAFTVSKLTFYMFSDTLSKAAHNSHIYWAFHRFLLVNEYRRKSPYPPPINLLHYTYKFLKFLYRLSRNKTSDNIHGSLDGASELDSNLYNIISFNAMDRAKISGTVTKVSINFSTAPTTTNPEIWLFVIAAATVASNPHFFIVISKRQLFEKSKQNTTANQQKSATIKLEKGIQTFDTDIKITEGQYLGIRFSPGAGNPYSTGRNQYYFNAPVEPVLNYSILFTNCPTKGIAMSFTVQKSKSM